MIAALLFLGLFLGLILGPSPAQADPIITPLAMALASGIYSAAPGLIPVLGIGGIQALSSAVVGGAIAAGASAAASALARTQTDKGSGFSSAPVARVNSPEVRGTVKQATPAQRIVFGETRIGGAIWFYKADPPFLYLGQMHSILPITQYVAAYIGERAVGPIGTDGIPLDAPYAGNLDIRTQAGALDQPAHSFLTGSFPEIDADFKLPGIANTVWRFRYGDDFEEFEELWGNVQIPDAQWIVRGAPVYDPRDPTQRLPQDLRDVEDLWDAISTWKYSNNAALIQAHWAMMPYGLNAGPDRIRWDQVARAADFDDEPVPLKGGGYQKRHTIDGVVTLDEKPLTVLEGMIISNRGFVTTRAGRVTVQSSRPEQPVFTITDGHMAGPFQYRDAKPKRELLNVGHTRFVAPDRQYQDADGPTLRRADLIASDGEVLEQTVRMPFVSTHQRAQRLMKAYLDEARLGRQVQCVLDMRAVGCVIGTVVRVWSELFPSSNGLYTVESWRLADDLSGVALALVEYSPGIARDWNADEDEQEFQLDVTEV